MYKIWIIAISVFIIITFLFWKLTIGYFKKEYKNKEWKLWGTKTFYWQGTLFICGGITVLTLFLLKEVNVLSF